MKAIQISRTGGPEVLEPVDLPVVEPKPNGGGLPPFGWKKPFPR